MAESRNWIQEHKSYINILWRISISVASCACCDEIVVKMRRFWIFIVQIILLSVCTGQELSAEKREKFLRAFADHLNRENGQDYIYEGGEILSCTNIVSNNLCYILFFNVIIAERLSWMCSNVILLLSRLLKLRLCFPNLTCWTYFVLRLILWSCCN